MNKISIIKYIKPLESYTRKNAPTILTVLGMVGVVGTAITAVKDSKKAESLIHKRNEYKLYKYGENLTKTEKVIAAVPAYLPTMISGITTISCIYGSNHINKERQAVLMGAYGYLNNCFTEYKNKVKELYGEDTDKNIRNSIAIDNYQKMKQLEEETENEQLYYDEFASRYFYMDPEKLTGILYEINKMYNYIGEMTLNDVYEYFDLEPTAFGSTVGWSALKDWECVKSAWIDIQIEPMEFPDDLSALVLKFGTDPSPDYIEWREV